MKWFGPSWDAPVNEGVDEAPVPVGTPCMGCDRPIGKGDQGLLVPHHGHVAQESHESVDDYIVRAAEAVRDEPWHLSCFIRAVLGPNMRGSFPRPR